MAEESFSFGSLLRRQRLAARLTQEELAARCGLGARTIQNLERGANLPRSETLDRLASLLDLAGETRARFEAAAKPLPPGPRDAPTRIERDDRLGLPEIVRLADRRHADPAANLSPLAKSIENAATSPEPRVLNNLPVQWTSFIGRERALLDVLRLLESNHLVTLTGAGGCGKTRLALEVAQRQVANYLDGVWLVELAPLSDPALVGQAVASALGLRETPGKPIAQTLTEHLQTEQTILIIDNCEHLIEAVARMVDTILHACPKVRVLATSREALRISGEVDWRVPSLAVPTANPATAIDDLVGVESVRLFVERGRAVRTDFGVTKQNAAAVVQICRRLDGLPLAIELAATQVKLLPIEQIAAGVDQRFRSLTVGSRTAQPRHQTLAAMVAWSYDLLTTSAQTLFNRLSVFAGGFTLDAATAVCGSSENVIAPLSELVSKSMVIADGGGDGVERYHLLETLRQYGWERLNEVGEAQAIQQRHAAYYLSLAEEVQPRLLGPEQLAYLAGLHLEWDNVRATMRWYLDQGLAEEGLRLVAALVMFLQFRGLDETEGFSWCTQLLALPVPARPSPARANGLMVAGLANIDLGNVALGRRLVVDSLTMARQLGDQRLIAWVMLQTGRWGLPHDDQWCGMTERGLLEGALALYRAVEDHWGIAHALMALGNLAHEDGDNAKGRQLLIESLASGRLVGDRHTIAQALLTLGEAISAESDKEAGAYLYESLRLSQEMGDVQACACIEVNLGRLEYLHQRYASAGAHYRAGLRSLKEIGYMYYLVRSVEGLAKVAAGQGRLERAMRLAAASAHLREVNGHIWRPIMQAELEHALAPARQTLAQSVATAAEGQAMTLEEAVSYALEDNGA